MQSKRCDLTSTGIVTYDDLPNFRRFCEDVLGEKYRDLNLKEGEDEQHDKKQQRKPETSK